jgi:hypothetical protein
MKNVSLNCDYVHSLKRKPYMMGKVIYINVFNGEKELILQEKNTVLCIFRSGHSQQKAQWILPSPLTYV